MLRIMRIINNYFVSASAVERVNNIIIVRTYHSIHSKYRISVTTPPVVYLGFSYIITLQLQLIPMEILIQNENKKLN